MTSEIRTNTITSRAGLSTVTMTDSGPMFSGITTFVDNSTFSVGTGGTIHAPATNVMALGTNSIDAIKIDSSGNVNVTGILTASSITGGVSLSGSTNNTVCTVTGANAIQGESTLTYDGSTLSVTGSQNSYLNNNILKFDRAGYSYIDQINDSGSLVFRVTSSNTNALRLDSNAQAIFGSSLYIPDSIIHDGDTDTKIRFPGSNQISFETGGAERFRISNIGHVTVNSTSYQALTITTSENGTNGPEIQLMHNTASPAAGDIVGQLRYSGKDSAGNTELYSKIETKVDSPTSGSETGFLDFSTRGGGSYNTILRLKARGTASAPSYTTDDHNGIILDTYNTGNPYPRYFNFIAKSAGNTDSNIGFWTEAVGGSPTEKLRINADGTVSLGAIDPSSSSVLHMRSNTSAETTLELSTVSNYNGSLPSAKISFTQQNGTEIARIKCDTNTGAANMADLTFWTNYGGLYERMRINKTGQVGINQTSPRRPLDIIGNDGTSGATSGNSDTTLLLDNAGGNGSMIEFLTANNSAGHIMFTDPDATNRGRISYHHSGDYLRFDAGGTEMLRLYSDVFRIGTSLGTAAGGRLQVVEERGGNQTNDCNVYFETNANDWNLKTYYNSTGTHYHIAFIEQGSFRGSVSGGDGSNVTFNSGSDYRWKENIVRMTGAEGIEICKKLQPSKYNWIENRKETGQINTVDGFIAHEVEESGVLGAVTGEKDAVNEDGSIKGQMLDYGQMTPVLTAAIKGLITKVETLEQDNIALRARVTNLEGN